MAVEYCFNYELVVKIECNSWEEREYKSAYLFPLKIYLEWAKFRYFKRSFSNETFYIWRKIILTLIVSLYRYFLHPVHLKYTILFKNKVDSKHPIITPFKDKRTIRRLKKTKQTTKTSWIYLFSFLLHFCGCHGKTIKASSMILVNKFPTTSPLKEWSVLWTKGR